MRAQVRATPRQCSGARCVGRARRRLRRRCCERGWRLGSAHVGGARRAWAHAHASTRFSRDPPHAPRTHLVASHTTLSCGVSRARYATLRSFRYDKKFDPKVADFAKMRVKELRKVCDDEGIDTKGLVEKDEYIKKVKAHFKMEL